MAEENKSGIRGGKNGGSADQKEKYLRVWLDPGLTLGTHATKVAENAGKTSTSLGRLMANLHGPRESKKKVLSSVVRSILLYEASGWSRALVVERTRYKMAKVQRQMAIRISSAYRTISYKAVTVIAGIPPIDLLAMKARYDTRVSKQGRLERDYGTGGKRDGNEQ